MPDVAWALQERDAKGPDSSTKDGHLIPMAFESRFARNGRGAPDVVVPPLKARSGETGLGDGAPLVFDEINVTHPENRSNPKPGDAAPTLHDPARSLLAFADVADPVAANQQRTYTREGTNNFRVSNVAFSRYMVRRLTPRECERLQGFPDDYTLVPYRGKPAADGPRYRALGNTMATTVMRWIGKQIQRAHNWQ